MKSFRHRLPPLYALMVFEAAAREQNFSRAARELHVSQAAVSQQVRHLEAYLETPLFRRQGRGVTLTRPGELLKERVNAALSYLVDAVEEATLPQQSLGVSLSANTAMSHLWLSPAIHAFRRHYRDEALHLRMVTSDRSSDLIADDIDIALLYDTPPRPGWQMEPLFEECLFPVAAPHYLDQHGRRLDSAKALLDHRLLDFERIEPNWVNWERWFSALGIEANNLAPESVFNSYSLLLDAAEQGHGVALGTRHQIDARLADGALERLGSFQVTTGCHYWLALRHDSKANREARQLADWLRAWVEADQSRQS
ncbi:LysR substrate-binding domain-containing protein [Halomonas salipaludis]|uniref:Transcriptional regulator n=1 Tax=Halomonas salipaludis TaxID=2032625 RepID=A0A2A2F1B6_9GAMM|nr:LysR substrate-binding domain-containing protein [Halomonas salipaludis]PAU79411.1 transcriptional regulator [Halomonas salipaludis]